MARVPLPELSFSVLNTSNADLWTGLMVAGFGLESAQCLHFRTSVGDTEIRLACLGDMAVGTAALLPMAQWLGGRPVTAAGLAAVTVAPGWQGRGIATALLRAMMLEARERGLALAVLHAATLPLYHRLGFARAGVCIDYCLSVEKTLAPLSNPARRVALNLCRLDLAKPTQLNELRRLQARWTNGLLERPPLVWANLLTPVEKSPPAAFLFLAADGRPDGYVLLRPLVRPGDTLRLEDLCLAGPAAIRQMPSFLAMAAAGASGVVWPGGPDDPLAHLAPETEVDIDDWDTWLARVLHVPLALTTRGYPVGLKAKLDLLVEDDVLTANQARWRLSVVNGGAVVEKNPPDPDEEALPSLTIPVAALAPLLTGHLSARALAAMGTLKGSNAALAMAELIFAGPAPWLADRF